YFRQVREVLPRLPETKKRRGFPRRFVFVCWRRDQRSSCSTLCCDWLASESADTAIDWRGGQRRVVRASLVGVGQRQVGRAGLQHVDQVLGEVLTDLHDREVRTEG